MKYFRYAIAEYYYKTNKVVDYTDEFLTQIQQLSLLSTSEVTFWKNVSNYPGHRWLENL